MTGVAAPVAAGRVDLDEHQAMDGRAGRQQIVDLAAGVVAAADGNRHVLRADQPGVVVFVCGNPSDGEFPGFDCGHGEAGAARQVERMGSAFEHGAAPADAGPRAAVRRDIVASGQVDEGEFAFAGLKLPGLARGKPARLERDVVPAGGFGRDREDQVGVACIARRADENVCRGVLLGLAHGRWHSPSVRCLWRAGEARRSD